MWTPKFLRGILYWCYARLNSNKTTSSKSRSELKGVALMKWESTRNLYVHAHGYYLVLIMKASRKDNYPLGKFLLHLQLVPLRSWFWPWYSPLIPFINNMEHLSSTSQRSSSTSVVFHPQKLTPLISRRYCGIAPPLMNSCWCDTSDWFWQTTGSGLSLTKNSEYLFLAIPFLDVVAIRWHPLKPLDMMCRGPHHP